MANQVLSELWTESMELLTQWLQRTSTGTMWFSSDTIDQVGLFLLLFVHCLVQSHQKLSKSHRWCLQAKNTVREKDRKQKAFFVFWMENYEEQFYLHKQRMGQKGQLPQRSSTQAFAFTAVESQTMSCWLSTAWLKSSMHAHTHTHTTVLSEGTHRAMFLRNRLCSDTLLSVKLIVSNSKMVNSCSRG